MAGFQNLEIDWVKVEVVHKHRPYELQTSVVGFAHQDVVAVHGIEPAFVQTPLVLPEGVLAAPVAVEEDGPDSPPRFVPLPPPTDSDVAQIVTSVRQRVGRALSRMLRVPLINALACGNCGAQMAQIATITQPHVIKPFLDCIDLPSAPPPIKPARAPPGNHEAIDW